MGKLADARLFRHRIHKPFSDVTTLRHLVYKGAQFWEADFCKWPSRLIIPGPAEHHIRVRFDVGRPEECSSLLLFV